MKTGIPIYTAEQSRELDAKTMQKYQLSDDVLMELAGAKATDFIGTLPVNHVLLLIGPGNNGGDGWVIARHLALQSNIEKIWIYEPFPEKRGKLNRLNAQRVESFVLTDKIVFLQNLDTIKADVIIDALFGTGLNKPIPEDIVSIIKRVNTLNAIKVSIDCPTGLDSTTGDLLPIAYKADYTLTFGGKKLGFFLNEAQLMTGKIIVLPIGFDHQLVSTNYSELPETFLGAKPSNRKHKYDDGYITLIAGSEGLSGAAFLAAKAALVAGAPAVELLYPKGLYPVFDILLPDVLKIGIGNDSDRHFKSNHLAEIQQLLEKGNRTVVLGPGLGRQNATSEFVHQLIPSLRGKTLIDADALTLLSDYSQSLPKNCILTPHWGELATLSAKKINSDYERIQTASNMAVSKQVWVFSKGTFGALCSPDGSVSFLPFSNELFRKTGFGDVFSGYFAGIWQNNDSILDTFLETSITLRNKAKPFSPTDLTPNHLL
ncbi:NAD(P)H-hydrate epimerase [bacterium]|nr:MAG: NAD(P)H-hydrate epimerase [bacterium]